MTSNRAPLIGYTCSYAPVQLIRAAGFIPYRILPETRAPDEAGRLMHDNLCSHVKQVLNRALSDDLPALDGMVFVNSCDAMRRLPGAWRATRPQDRMIVLELPSVLTAGAISFFAGELGQAADRLSSWSGDCVTRERCLESVSTYNELARLGRELRGRSRSTARRWTHQRVQEFYNLACTGPAEEAIAFAKSVLSSDSDSADLEAKAAVPIYLFGNILASPEVFALVESCGALVVGDDLCTGSRGIRQVEVDPSTDLFVSLSKSFLEGPSCARLVDPADLNAFALRIAADARAANARGVIGHTPKFCDPYLAKIPIVRNVLKAASLPLLMLEGPCAASSFGQHRLRIEAFIEQLR